MTPEAEQQALTDLLASDGWAIFLRRVEEAFGPAAFVRAIDAALETVGPDEERAITSRVRDTFKGVQAMTQWPAERIRALTAGTATSSDRFAALRRMARAGR